MSESVIEVLPNSIATEVLAHLGDAELDVDGVRCCKWLSGASASSLPGLQIIEIKRKSDVLYCTAGASTVVDGPGYGLEFFMLARKTDDVLIELMAMVAHFHSNPEHRLGLGHTLRIGRPIVKGSSLDRLLISLPYPFGPDFEYMHFSNGSHARMLWLVPITQEEEEFRHKVGLDALEELLERQGIPYSDLSRHSALTLGKLPE